MRLPASSAPAQIRPSALRRRTMDREPLHRSLTGRLDVWTFDDTMLAVGQHTVGEDCDW